MMFSDELTLPLSSFSDFSMFFITRYDVNAVFTCATRFCIELPVFGAGTPHRRMVAVDIFPCLWISGTQKVGVSANNSMSLVIFGGRRDPAYPPFP